MVSYTRLNPDSVQFSSAVLSEEPCPGHEERLVSSCVSYVLLLTVCLEPSAVSSRNIKTLSFKCIRLFVQGGILLNFDILVSLFYCWIRINLLIH